MMFSAKLLGLILVAVATHETSSLECYSCISTSGGYCGGAFHDSIISTRECSPLDDRCSKTVAVTDDDLIVRGCADSKLCEQVKVDSCDICSEDFCNSSSNVVPSVTILIVTTCFFVIYTAFS